MMRSRRGKAIPEVGNFATKASAAAAAAATTVPARSTHMHTQTDARARTHMTTTKDTKCSMIGARTRLISWHPEATITLD